MRDGRWGLHIPLRKLVSLVAEVAGKWVPTFLPVCLDIIGWLVPELESVAGTHKAHVSVVSNAGMATNASSRTVVWPGPLPDPLVFIGLPKVLLE